MSRLIALLLLACLFAAPTWACRLAHSPEYYNDADNVARTEIIFVGHVTRVDEVPGDAVTATTAMATYRLVERVKGEISPVGTIATSYSNCHVALLPGGDYVFFAERDRNGRLAVKAGHAGTRTSLSRIDKSIAYLNTIKKYSASNKTPSRP